MKKRDKWIRRLEKVEERHGFEDGFKLVFGPWKSLNGLDTAFLSLMPSLPYPDNAELRLISEERGNAFKLEAKDANSKFNEQFLKLAKLIGRKPKRIMTGVATPFRVKKWNNLTTDQRQASLAIGRKFWKKPLNQPSMKLIIVTSSAARDLVVDITKAEPDKSIPSGWGKIRLNRYKTSNKKTIVHLPDLGRYKLLSRKECIGQLNKILRGSLK